MVYQVSATAEMRMKQSYWFDERWLFERLFPLGPCNRCIALMLLLEYIKNLHQFIN